MQYSILYSEENQIVKINSTGKTNFKLAEQYSKDALKVAHENNCSRFLIDHTNTDPSVNIHSTGEELQQFGFQITDRIAIVIKQSQPVITVNHNSRWSESKYFDNVQEAISWLVTEK